MDPIYLFTLAGSFAMAGALSAREAMHKAIENSAASADEGEQNPAQQDPLKRVLISGNISAVALVITLVYGWQQFAWWTSVAFCVVSFPAIYYLCLRRIVTPKWADRVFPVLAWLALLPIIGTWLA